MGGTNTALDQASEYFADGGPGANKSVYIAFESASGASPLFREFSVNGRSVSGNFVSWDLDMLGAVNIGFVQRLATGSNNHFLFVVADSGQTITREVATTGTGLPDGLSLIHI